MQHRFGRVNNDRERKKKWMGGGKEKSNGKKSEGETAPINYERRKPVGSLREGNTGTSPTVKE